MHTAYSSDLGGGLYRETPLTETPRQRRLDRETPPPHMEIGTEPPRRNMRPGCQTESDIIQRPTPMDMTDASGNITLHQTSFAGGNKFILKGHGQIFASS